MNGEIGSECQGFIRAGTNTGKVAFTPTGMSLCRHANNGPISVPSPYIWFVLTLLIVRQLTRLRILRILHVSMFRCPSLFPFDKQSSALLSLQFGKRTVRPCSNVLLSDQSARGERMRYL